MKKFLTAREIALRERQLLPIFVWLHRLGLQRELTGRSLVEHPELLSQRLLQRIPSLAHFRPSFPAHLPELAQFSFCNDSANKASRLVKLLDDTDMDAVQREFPHHSHYASKVQRHNPLHLRDNLLQEVSLAEHAAWVCSNLNFRPKVVVDAGGGNGILAHLCEHRFNCDSVVIDTERPPCAVDEVQNPSPFFRRIEKDLSNVEWRRDLMYSAQDVLVISKHLCGGGVDMTLRSMAEQNFFPRALALSSCCHFKRQNSATYIANDFLASLGLSDDARPWVRELDSNIIDDAVSFLVPLTQLKAPRVRNRPCSREHIALQHRDGEKKAEKRIRALIERYQSQLASNVELEVTKSRQNDFRRTLLSAIASRTNWIVDSHSPPPCGSDCCGCRDEEEDGIDSAHRKLGLQIEALLDAGRVQFLRGNGYAAAQTEFVPSVISPRNKVLLAWRRGGELVS